MPVRAQTGTVADVDQKDDPTVEPLTDALVDDAARLARRWLAATEAGQTPAERRTTGRLGALVANPAGLELAVRFVDRVARPEDVQVAARELAALGPVADRARAFLGPADRVLLALGARLAPRLPRVVVPAARLRLRQLVGHLVADAGPGLGPHLARVRAEGFRVNLNLLGEAVLGDAEADARLRRTRDLLERDDVDYVSVKVSAVASQLPAWDHEAARARVVERLLPLYREAARTSTFVNLDMEEYKDLGLTVEVFRSLLAEPGLRDLEMGIVLQAYLPDAADALDEITRMAAERRAQGGARIKVRLVKGANLAMEHVDAELHGWEVATYGSKPEVDANYVRLVDRALRPARTADVRIGVASHNLFHVALAHLLAEQRGVTEALDVEMLQGMAPAQARAVRADVGDLLLYTPVVAKGDFDVAISYLVRRLEENAAEQNFLHAMFAPDVPGRDGSGPGDAIDRQEAAFRASVRDREVPSTSPRRRPRLGAPDGAAPTDPTDFTNAPDTDPALPAHRAWALDVLGREPGPLTSPFLSTTAEVDAVVERALAVGPDWAATHPGRRAEVLRAVGDALEAVRGDLVAVMAHEAGKTVAEADPEVSEAVDFARYYARSALGLAPGAVRGARFTPARLAVVTPPWNFPVAIPLGSALAALAAGVPAILKPAPQTPRCVEVAVAAVHVALRAHDIPVEVLQVVRCPDDEVGQRLVTHPAVERVLLTGSIETARMFAGWRPDLDVIAETSGKNAIVVTPSADLDLAVADVVRSAFGHAGQKCSAASLVITVGSVATSDRFRRQLVDAVRSLRVGPATDPATAMGPVVEAPGDKLERALTQLEPGESWLVRPERLTDDGRSWTPGVRTGVAPRSWFHLTEAFGPVLGVMTAQTLDEAISLQNAVPFGLTGGIHSLDDDEVAHWLDRVEVGNAYVNRHITGAIVQRQPFGGWKASSVGPGAKAGGPHYLAQLGTWTDDPDEVPSDDAEWLTWASADDATAWSTELGVEQDPSGLRVEQNALRFRPVPGLTVRIGADAADREVARVLAAAERVAVPVTVSRQDAEDDAAFAERVRAGQVTGRVRVVGTVTGLREAAAEVVGDVTVLDHPVVASGRRELLTVLREQAVSRTRHRFGHVTTD